LLRRDIYAIGPYVVALIVSCYFYSQAMLIAPAGEGRVGPDAWPKAVLILAILTCIWEIARNMFAGRRRDAVSGSSDDAASADALLPRASAPQDADASGGIVPWIGIGLTTAYVIAFPWLGYFLATLVYVAAFVFLGGYRRPLVAVCLAVAASLAFMFLFMRIVYVSLPIGIDPFAQVSTLLMRAMGIR